MIDLRQDLLPTWRTISRAPGHGEGRAVMFISARTGEGTSSVAASISMLAAQRSTKGVWLVDLDLAGDKQFNAFHRGEFSRILGPLGQPHAAEAGGDTFFSVTPSYGDRESARDRFVVHRAGQSRLLVSRFRSDLLRADQKITIRTGASYWKKVRSTSDWIIVDAPALDQSGAGLAVCSQMDSVVIVVRADKTPVAEASRVCQEIEAHGGVCSGIVLNGVRKDARFIEQIMG